MHSMAVVGFLSRLEKMSKDFDVILDRHGDKPNNLSAIPIDCACMGHTKHHELFVLVHMKLVAKVVSMVGYWIQLPCCSCPAGMLVDRTGPLK